MFNQSPFNAAPFNLPPTIDVILYPQPMSGFGRMTATPSVEIQAQAAMSGRGWLTADFVREIFQYASFSGEGTMSAEALRERIFIAAMSGEGHMIAQAMRYEVKYIYYSGPLAPGDQLVIDMENYTVTLNGETALHLIDGAFFGIRPGDNELIFEDSESTRQLRIKVAFHDQYL